jgi:molybdate transport system substrate-binding protein
MVRESKRRLSKQTLSVFITALLGLGWPMIGDSVQAGEAMVAVAANFAAPMKLIAAEFERDTGHSARLSFGGTGQFYAQIKNGAPFDVFLAADSQTPAKLIEQGLAVRGSEQTYATGKLVLWSKNATLVNGNDAVLARGEFKKIAIADPKLAPYGRAAQQVMVHLGLMDSLAPKLVVGKSIAQTFQFVASGNAELGFVALSQVFYNGQLTEGSAWLVPDGDYDPIRQDLVLLKRAHDSAPARALIQYMQRASTKKIIESFGYQP